ncbi:unnamed protein product [Brassica oleracea]
MNICLVAFLLFCFFCLFLRLIRVCSQRRMSPARKRLMRDFSLRQDPPAGISGAPQDNNIMLWNAVIFGPEDSHGMEFMQMGGFAWTSCKTSGPLRCSVTLIRILMQTRKPLGCTAKTSVSTTEECVMLLSKAGTSSC